jgi:hypothetical protein
MTAEDLKSELKKCASDIDAAKLGWFFKTGPGQYGEGDVFIGVRVPQTRKVCKDFKNLSANELKKLLASMFHHLRGRRRSRRGGRMYESSRLVRNLWVLFLGLLLLLLVFGSK